MQIIAPEEFKVVDTANVLRLRILSDVIWKEAIKFTGQLVNRIDGK